jgi:hypothetical protein
MKVKFIKPHPAYAYFVGDVAELSAEHTATLLKSGYAVEVKAEKTPEAPKTPSKKK